MFIEITHHGGAITCESGTFRLKDLLPLDRLGEGGTRLKAASMTSHRDGARLELTLTDGSSHPVRLPEQGPPSYSAADLIIENAGQILTMEGDGVGLQRGGTIYCGGERILGVIPRGAQSSSMFEVQEGAARLDARGGLVSPGLVDPHTHPVFGGQRSFEFGLKSEGKSYMEIHKAGGGILSTVNATREASFEELSRACARNLSLLLDWGVTTCEGKSGYALELAGELRMLEVLRTVSDCHPVDVERTLLGAHTLPPEYSDRREEYVQLVAEQMVPEAARRGLAQFCDAYCEDGAFTPQEVERIFSAARAAGLGLRLHAEQFTDQGGAALAADLGAASADHLEAINPAGIAAMAKSGTTAVILPGAALACRCPWPPARALLDAGVPVALGTDLNPGSSMTSSLPLMMSLACMQMRMSCDEVWRAVTRDAARSIGRGDIGRIGPGALADLVIFDAPDYRYIPYHYGDNHARVVLKRGQVVRDAEACAGRAWPLAGRG